MTFPRGADRSGPEAFDVTATVKWFDPGKGFGFVKPDDGSPDAFLHISVLSVTGHQTLPEGSILVVDIGQGRRGPQVQEIKEIKEVAEAPARAPRPDRFDDRRGGYDDRRGGGGGGFDDRRGGGGGGGGGGFDRPRPESGPTIEGTVKFFNSEKGFGFVQPDDGSRDVFVSARTLQRFGINELQPETRVRVETMIGDKGPMAARVQLI